MTMRTLGLALSPDPDGRPGNARLAVPDAYNDVGVIAAHLGTVIGTHERSCDAGAREIPAEEGVAMVRCVEFKLESPASAIGRIKPDLLRMLS